MPNSPATSGKPDGYPYITLHSNGHFWSPVLIDWSLEAGAEQVADLIDGVEDPAEAKRLAVNWSKLILVPYKVAVHG